MAGLNLGTGFRAYAAQPPSAAGTTITTAAYGPASGADMPESSNAFYGTVGAGIIGLAFLAWLWSTLPR